MRDPGAYFFSSSVNAVRLRREVGMKPVKNSTRQTHQVSKSAHRNRLSDRTFDVVSMCPLLRCSIINVQSQAEYWTMCKHKLHV